MTGMKNRYAYEKILEDLEDGICNWKNAVLIFMDMNHLKQIMIFMDTEPEMNF